MQSKLFFSCLKLILVGSLTLNLAGCGKNQVVTGTVSGSVAAEGKPVTGGQVVLSSSELGVNQAAKLSPEGTFQMTTPIPVGKYVVYLLPPDQGDVPPGLPSEQPVNPLQNVPKKYQDERTSDLSMTVEKGENNATFDLKP